MADIENRNINKTMRFHANAKETYCIARSHAWEPVKFAETRQILEFSHSIRFH